MADKKRKLRVEKTSSGSKNKRKNSTSNEKRREKAERAHRGSRLPNALQKEVEEVNSLEEGPSDSDDGFGNDVYEYEEAFAEEETTKNKRFDPVLNYEYKLGEDFNDENVASDEDDDEDKNDNEDDGRHARMLQGITGLPSDAFEGKKKKDFIVSEAYPESEYNPSRDILDGDGLISIGDLLDPLHEMPGFSKLRKNIHRMDKKSIPILTPLPKTEQERLERKAAYAHSKKDITKWEPLVKRNREASTLYFDEDVDLGFSTIGAIASVFEPRTDFEKKMASLVNHDEIVEAHQKDGARLLEMNPISVKDEKNRKDLNAKRRNLLFLHEIKAKRIKKIKSKTYHRLLKKDKKKAAGSGFLDPDAAKELAMKQEFKRAEERMTLKHKNSSKWAKRILERGLQVQDEGTRVAFREQNDQHAALTRKMNSVNESSSGDESSDSGDSDYMSDGSDKDFKSKLLKNARKKTLKVLEGNEELPKSGLLSLPFMVRELKKRKEAADEEATAAIEEYESSLKQLEDNGETEVRGASSGRRVFGVTKKAVAKPTKKVKSDNYFDNSDSESDVEPNEGECLEHNGDNNHLREVDIEPSLLHEAFEINHDDTAFKNFEDGVEDPESKTTYDVAYLDSNSWKKMKKSSDGRKKIDIIDNIGNFKVIEEEHDQDTEEGEDEYNDDSDTDSGGEMVDGILSSVSKSTYELPSQAELILRAFAGDDVEEDFEKDKEAVLDEENPQPEEPKILPGWGQWTDIQKKRGLPTWMIKEHETAKNNREEALKKRKDAHLNNVIISEKLDKKAEKLHTKTLPYPFTSKEVFEQSIRMPIGPEFNPATTVGALNRPEVVKKAGVIIKPISFEDMNVREKAEFRKRSGQKSKNSKEKSKNSKDKNKSMKKKVAKV